MATVLKLRTGDECSWSPESEDTRVPGALHQKKPRVTDTRVSCCISKLYPVCRLVGRCPESRTIGCLSSILYFMFQCSGFICEWRPDVIWQKGFSHRFAIQSVFVMRPEMQVISVWEYFMCLAFYLKCFRCKFCKSWWSAALVFGSN